MSKHLVDPRLWEPTQRRQAAQVVARRQAANERRVLDQRADTPSESLRLPNRHTEHGACSARSRDQTQQHANRRRLARPVRAHEPNHTTSGNIERQIVHRNKVTESPRQTIRSESPHHAPDHIARHYDIPPPSRVGLASPVAHE
jgi:hypothetical protein